ncbi:MAG: glutamine--fructose-6-phosphate transaminase (isomerizing) [Oligoflexia bacterium]|nr:glutamine--fructose-6-phosphate transaminase (isomerizing) [Oligoflexia bacterium]
MCGIIGYIGSQNAVDVIMNGLTKLEYRGYDSAGICVRDVNADDDSDDNITKSKLDIYKVVGKIQNLKDFIKDKNIYSNIGIGHTRWATHGGVVNENAHPHGDQKVAIVHNGIIENAAELREMLIKEGHIFYSDTDSEVFFILTNRLMNAGHTLRESVGLAFEKIEGNSAFVVIDHQGREIITVRRSAPLVLGDNKASDEAFVSSDPYALVGYADRLYFPEDRVVSVLSCSNKYNNNDHKKIRMYELDGSESTRFYMQAQKIEHYECDKGQFEHYMLKEIYEQPGLIRNWLRYYLEGEGENILNKVAEQISVARKVHIVACGTAWHAGLVIRDYIEKYTRIFTSVDLASEFRYRNPILNPNEDVAIFISQSGETADTLAAQELCKKEGISTFSIINVENSSLYRSCQQNLLIKAEIEIGVASTKAFTLQVLTGYLLACKIRDKFILNVDSVRPSLPLVSNSNSNSKKDMKKDISRFANKIELLLTKDKEIQEIAGELFNKKGFIYTGRGNYFPIALEGALKLKEIAYVHAEGYAAGELKHGPIALIDEEMVNVAIIGPELYDKTLSNISEIRARKGIIFAMGPENVKNALGKNDYFIPLDFSDKTDLHPIYINIATQLFAYFVAKYKGTDIDKPRNLAKSVTVE